MSIQLQVDQVLADDSADLKLQLGCGHNLLPGWINTDIEPDATADYLDFSKPFPFQDDVFAAVFCEHTIEHLPKPTGLHLISETFRVLKPGGQFRIVTPSLEKLCRLALEPGSAPAAAYVEFFRRMTGNMQATIADAVNMMFYGHGHRHIYMMEELGGLLGQVGFTGVRVMTPGSYGHQIFHGVDGHGRVIGENINAIEAMALEASKP